MPSDDGEILSDVWESPDDRSRFSQDCAEPGGRGRVLSRRIAGFSCRWQEICFAGLASRGLRKSDVTLEQQAAFVEEAPEIFLRIPGGWGKMGHTHICLAASEDVLTGALRTAWQLRIEKNAKTHGKKRP